MSGVVGMYHTKGFWGMESNQNVNTWNTTFNVYPSLSPIFIVVIIILIIFMFCAIKKGFGV